MRTRRLEQTALTTFLLAACLMFFMAAYAAIAHAQNPSNPGDSLISLPTTHSVTEKMDAN
jgi:hypothetical protein